MTSPPVEAPVYWRDRTFTITEMTYATAVPYDTFSAWFRLIRAMDRPFGNKVLGKWTFSAHELYGLHLIAALYRLGHPINVGIIRTALDFADGGGMNQPDSNLIIRSPDDTAFIVVPAKVLWMATLKNCESVLEAADENS